MHGLDDRQPCSFRFRSTAPLSIASHTVVLGVRTYALCISIVINYAKLSVFLAFIVSFAYVLWIQSAQPAIIGLLLLAFICLYAVSIRWKNSQKAKQLEAALLEFGSSIEPETALSIEPGVRTYAYVDGKAIFVRISVQEAYLYVYKWNAFSLRIAASDMSSYPKIVVSGKAYREIQTSDARVLIPIPALFDESEMQSDA